MKVAPVTADLIRRMHVGTYDNLAGTEGDGRQGLSAYLLVESVSTRCKDLEGLVEYAKDPKYTQGRGDTKDAPARTERERVGYVAWRR